MIDVQAAALYRFYKAHDPAVHFSAGYGSEAACHLVAVLAYSQVLFTHVIAVMDSEIRQEQQVVSLCRRVVCRNRIYNSCTRVIC